MFKTIEECKLDLVSHTVFNDVIQSSVDFMPCSSARVSFGNEDKTGKSVEADKKLMKYLADHQHMSPFEHQSATFLVEVPLFIRSQIMRHRTFAYNEISRRYTDENLEFWVPTTFRKQSDSNRQASTEETIIGRHTTGLPSSTATMEFSLSADDLYGRDKTQLMHTTGHHSSSIRELCLNALYLYEAMVKAGVAREQARAMLPQSLLTKFYMTGNLRNWAHFIELRKDAHAQKEVQIVAERIESELRKLWPNSMEALLGNEEEGSEAS